MRTRPAIPQCNTFFPNVLSFPEWIVHGNVNDPPWGSRRKQHTINEGGKGTYLTVQGQTIFSRLKSYNKFHSWCLNKGKKENQFLQRRGYVLRQVLFLERMFDVLSNGKDGGIRRRWEYYNELRTLMTFQRWGKLLEMPSHEFALVISQCVI